MIKLIAFQAFWIVCLLGGATAILMVGGGV